MGVARFERAIELITDFESVVVDRLTILLTLMAGIEPTTRFRATVFRTV